MHGWEKGSGVACLLKAGLWSGNNGISLLLLLDAYASLIKPLSHKLYPWKFPFVNIIIWTYFNLTINPTPKKQFYETTCRSVRDRVQVSPLNKWDHWQREENFKPHRKYFPRHAIWRRIFVGLATKFKDCKKQLNPKSRKKDRVCDK